MTVVCALRCCVFASCLSAADLLLGCQRKPEPPTTKPSASASASASARAVASAPPAPMVAHAVAPPERLLLAWSDALSRRASDELLPFYSPRVLYYGQRKTAAEVVAAKRHAFERLPGYQQRVSNVHIDEAPNGFVLRFDKRSGAALESNVAARLVVEAHGDELTIAEESDFATDARFRKPTQTTCGQAVFRVVNEQPTIAADITRVAHESPDVNPGGITYDEQPGRISASQGYFHADHYEPRFWLEASAGALTIRDAYTNDSLPLSSEQTALIRRSCPARADRRAE